MKTAVASTQRYPVQANEILSPVRAWPGHWITRQTSARYGGLLLLAMQLLGVPASNAQTSGQVLYDPPKAIELGRELVTQLRTAMPEREFTNTGSLYIKARRQPLVKIAYTCRVVVTPTNWISYYSARSGSTNLPGFSVEHRPHQPSLYRDDAGALLSGSQLDVPFAGSDFWLSDLGLEFLHWPEQRVSRWEMARSIGCKVLESKNPAASSSGYSRVVTWIQDDANGIVQAEAYDARGKLLKEFRPTELEKINGQHELKEMMIENVQSGSKTRLEFEL